MKLRNILASETLRRFLKTLRHFDFLLIAAALAMGVFGVFMVYAATNTGVMPRFANMYVSQRVFLISGVALMLFVAFIDYRFITKFYWVIYGLCVALLVIVWLIGRGSGDPARWIVITLPALGEVSIQPSEFAKIFMILFLAKLIEKRQETFNHILILSLILISIAVPVYLIYKQPSLSACIVVLVTSLVVLFAGGLYYRTVLISALVVVPVGLAAWFDLLREKPLFMGFFKEMNNGYQWERIETFLNPVAGTDEYLQVQQSLYSIGSGGLYGKGFGNNSYVINGHNDFVFSVIGEQFGFVGCAAVLAVMAFIIIKCILTALRASDLQGRMIAAGVAGMLLFETFVNVGVVTSLLPNTGMPFPFISAGGTAMWVHMAEIGLVVNIGIPRDKSIFEARREL
ncbi:MAG: FtsW/RodA/SpoVE family cell cycle protein [Clostridiales bacterium]|jgi:rod shape determining protein RodA|nr:FtsW/RodA/SpoVE family cell cycle protein [Clostridiales bacterium]